LQGALLERAKKVAENISHQHLLKDASEERKTLETSIIYDIRKLDAKFLRATVKDPGVDTLSTGDDRSISQYSGWSFWDLGKLLVGGGSAGGAVVAGSRAALGALAAPVTIAAGLAGLAWSAYLVFGQKRTEYLKALNAGILQTLTANDGPETSVLSRQLARIDAIRDIRLERLL
jgi:hypothetical protein